MAVDPPKTTGEKLRADERFRYGFRIVEIA